MGAADIGKGPMGEVFSQSDLDDFKKIGISSEEVLQQIGIFQQGVPFTQLEAPCTPPDGIRILSPDQVQKYSTQFEKTMAAGRAMKFVPASGAASRMFRDLLAFYNSEAPVPKNPAVQEFFQKLPTFPFYPELEAGLLARGKEIRSLLQDNQFREVLRYLLEEPGLAYGNAPKGLIPFHNYGKFRRTPFEEQIVEAIQYVQDQQGGCEIHFTLGSGFLEEITALLSALGDKYKEDRIDLKIEISLQKSSTSTLAVDLDDHPFRVGDKKILFRPGGHGALLENLDDLDGDIVFIKNIFYY